MTSDGLITIMYSIDADCLTALAHQLLLKRNRAPFTI